MGQGVVAPPEQVRRGELLGVGLTLLAVCVGGVQSVYTGRIVQDIDPILLLAVCILPTLIWFNVLQAKGWREYVQVVRKNRGTVAMANLFTLGSWAGSFAALRFIEPAIANSIMVGVIPISTIAASWVLRRETTSVLRSEMIASIAMVLVAIVQIVLISMGKSGLGTGGTVALVIGVSCTLINGVSNGAVSTVNKRLSEAGVVRSQVLASRLILPLLACIGYLIVVRPPLAPLFASPDGVAVSFFGSLGAVYLVQAAVERAEPITIELVIALLPLVVFGIQSFDDRLAFSSLSLITTSIMVALIVWSTLQRLRST